MSTIPIKLISTYFNFIYPIQIIMLCLFSELGGALEDPPRTRHRRDRNPPPASQAVLLGPQRGLARPRAAEPALRAGQGRHPRRTAPRHYGQR